MRFRTLLFVLAASLASCDRAPLTMGFSKVPGDRELTATEKAIVDQRMGEFLRLGTPADTVQLKTLRYDSGRSKVCGLVGHEWFLAGDLTQNAGTGGFSIIAVVDTTDLRAPDGIDINKLCRS